MALAFESSGRFTWSASSVDIRPDHAASGPVTENCTQLGWNAGVFRETGAHEAAEG